MEEKLRMLCSLSLEPCESGTRHVIDSSPTQSGPYLSSQPPSCLIKPVLLCGNECVSQTAGN